MTIEIIFNVFPSIIQYIFDFVKDLETRNLAEKIEYSTKSNIFNIIAYVELKIFHFTESNTWKNRGSTVYYLVSYN